MLRYISPRCFVYRVPLIFTRPSSYEHLIFKRFGKVSFLRYLSTNAANKIVDEITGLYTKYGHADYIGEPISQLDHALQCALQAKKEGYTHQVITGALLHDIGQILGTRDAHEKMGTVGTQKHEELGANYLQEQGFNAITCSIVRNHVSAKRFLVAADVNYYNKLSDASKQTLIYQGGKMSVEEIRKYMEDKNYRMYLRMRRWDDRAKVPNMKLPTFEEFIPYIIKSIKN